MDINFSFEEYTFPYDKYYESKDKRTFINEWLRSVDEVCVNDWNFIMNKLHNRNEIEKKVKI